MSGAEWNKLTLKNKVIKKALGTLNNGKGNKNENYFKFRTGKQ